MYQRLPARFDQVDGSNWIPDVYRSQMPRVNVQASSQDLPLLDDLIRKLIHAWQAKAPDGPVSTFAYNFFSQGFYSNPAAEMVFQEAFDYLIFTLHHDRTNRPEAIVAKVASEYAVISSALCAKQFPELFDHVTPQAEQEIVRILTQWDQIRIAMDRFFGGAAQQQYNSANPYRQQQRNGQFGTIQEDMLASPGSRQQAAPGYRRGPSAVQRQAPVDDRPVADHLVRRGVEVQPAKPVETVVQPVQSRASVGRSSADIVEARAPEPISTRDHARSTIGAAHQEPTLQEQFVEVEDDEGSDDDNWLTDIRFSNELVAEVETKAPSEQQAVLLAVDRIILPVPPIGLDEQALGSYYEDNAGKGYTIQSFSDDPERPWDLVTLTNDYLMIPVHLSGFKPTRTQQRPMPSYPYDIDSEMKFHLVVPSTNNPSDKPLVTEVILPLEESMKYLDHEFNDSKRQAALVRQQEKDNVMPDWTLLSKVEPLPAGTLSVERQRLIEEEKTRSAAVEAGEEVEELKPLQKPIIIPVIPIAHTAEQAVVLADQYRAEFLSAKNPTDASVLEITADSVTPFVTNGNVALLEPFTKVDKAASPAKALVDALGMYGLETKDRFYNRINDVATTIVNAVIEYRLGITDCRITNFVMDYDALVDMVREEYGDGTHQRFIGLTNAILSQLKMELGSSVPAARLQRIDGFDRNSFEANKARYIVLTHQYKVLYINRTLAELKVYQAAKDRNSFALLASSHPDLHAIVCATRARMKTLNDKKGGTLFVVSRDDRILQLHQSAWDGNWFTATPGISLASPVL